MPNEVDFQVATLQRNSAKADATGGPRLCEPVLNKELEAVLTGRIETEGARSSVRERRSRWVMPKSSSIFGRDDESKWRTTNKCKQDRNY